MPCYGSTYRGATFRRFHGTFIERVTLPFVKLTQGLRAVVLSGVFACAASCESKPLEPDSASSIPTPATPAEFVDTFAVEICRALAECCGQQGVPVAVTCRELVAASIAPEIADLASLQVDWDKEAARHCIQDYSNYVCSERALSQTEAKARCSSMFRGRLAPGEPCVSSSECRAEPGESASCDTGDVCQVHPAPARLEMGESCAASDLTCAEDAYCNAESWVCEPRLAAGAGPCSEVAEACQLPAICDYTTGKCMNPKRSGEACDERLDCLSLSCRNGVCVRQELPETLCADPSNLLSAPAD